MDEDKKLNPNPAKTECMTIGHPRRIKQLVISEALLLNGTEIKRIHKSKALGVVIDESSTWDEQFKAVKSAVINLRSLKSAVVYRPKRRYHTAIAIM